MLSDMTALNIAGKSVKTSILIAFKSITCPYRRRFQKQPNLSSDHRAAVLDLGASRENRDLILKDEGLLPNRVEQLTAKSNYSQCTSKPKTFANKLKSAAAAP